MIATNKIIELEQKIAELEKGMDTACHESEKAVYEQKESLHEAHRNLKIEQEKVNALEGDIAQQVEQLRMSKGELASLVKEHEFTLTQLLEQTNRAEKAENEIMVLCEQVVAREKEVRAYKTR